MSMIASSTCCKSLLQTFPSEADADQDPSGMSHGTDHGTPACGYCPWCCRILKTSIIFLWDLDLEVTKRKKTNIVADVLLISYIQHNNISSLTLRKNTSEILQSLENKHPTPLEQYEVQANPEPRTPCHGKTNGETTVSLRSEQVLRDRPESTGTAVLFLSGKEPDLLRAMTDGHEHQHGEKPSNNIKELTYYLFTPMGNFHTHRLVEKHGESCSCNTPRQLT
ncbi:uncharacterized protein isoform X4 [Danio rerio]|uniref:Uncharacterized protein isoform X4 n=1 Tax=Danio rerio TaxID=7955 RepID=A0AC58HLG6_DANRE